MTTLADIIGANAIFAAATYRDDLTINPWGNLTVVGCVDSRVDPSHIFGLGLGEAAAIRNVGGRITPSTLRTLAMLAKVRQANGATAVPGTRTLIVLHHTDCGITDIAAYPDLLAEYFEIPAEDLDSKAVLDPVAAVRIDTEVLLTELRGPDTLVAGVVYDVSTGRAEVVVEPTFLPT